MHCGSQASHSGRSQRQPAHSGRTQASEPKPQQRSQPKPLQPAHSGTDLRQPAHSGRTQLIAVLVIYGSRLIAVLVLCRSQLIAGLTFLSHFQFVCAST